MVWRDAVTAWFQNISGIPDKLGRVGIYPTVSKPKRCRRMDTPGWM